MSAYSKTSLLDCDKDFKLAHFYYDIDELEQLQCKKDPQESMNKQTAKFEKTVLKRGDVKKSPL